MIYLIIDEEDPFTLRREGNRYYVNDDEIPLLNKARRNEIRKLSSETPPDKEIFDDDLFTYITLINDNLPEDIVFFIVAVRDFLVSYFNVTDVMFDVAEEILILLYMNDGRLFDQTQFIYDSDSRILLARGKSIQVPEKQDEWDFVSDFETAFLTDE